MAARQSAPVLGALCSRAEHRPAAAPKRQPWSITFGYRFQPTSRHFIGTVEQKQREEAGNQIQNTYHLFNVPFAVERNRKISVTDYQNHTHGDAAFADYALIVGFSRRF